MEGAAFLLRPIRDADAAFVLELRCNPTLNRHLHQTSPRLEDQLAWLRRYYERLNDFYFVVERADTEAPEGVVAIYDIDPTNGRAEWGRWILRPGSNAAVECAWLIYRSGFERLRLREMVARTSAENQGVVSFHDSCGIMRREVLHEHFDLNGRHVDAIEHTMDLETWARVAPNLAGLAKLTARRLRRQ